LGKSFNIFPVCLLSQEVWGTRVDLTLEGPRSFCAATYPGQRIEPVAAICKVNSGSLNWFMLKGHHKAPLSVKFAYGSYRGPVLLMEGVEATKISPESDSTISSKLKVHVPLSLLPVTIFCGSNFRQKKKISLQTAGKVVRPLKSIIYYIMLISKVPHPLLSN